MKVLIACEESQRVCTEFRRLGHEAYSCDIIDQSGGRPDWHIIGDVVPFLNGYCTFTTTDGTQHIINSPWDLIIGHPPCTYLSNAGARHLYPNGILNMDRYQKGIEGKKLFMTILNVNCDRICVENPVPSKVYNLPPYTQIIHPYQFGHVESKRTCLWLKGLPKLIPTNIISKELRISTKILGNWYNIGGKERQKNRSKTFHGIAKAMAEQWGKEI